MADACGIVQTMTDQINQNTRQDAGSGRDVAAGERMTHFGFTDVPEAEKTGRVRGVFDEVASHYDLMNDLMSLGIHRLWKDIFISGMRPKSTRHLLDVAGGTGDIAFRFLEAGGGRVSVMDINHEMIKTGRDRAINQGRLQNICWGVGNAEELPLPDNMFDLYTIAFGIRNVTRIDLVLSEAHRVLRPGGRFMCLEFSKVTRPGLNKLYDVYSFKLLPEIGRLVAKNRDAYQYLVESIRQFPDQHRFADMISAAGFEKIRFRNLSGGVAAIHSGWKI